MKNLPIKPIEEIFVLFDGDPLVGIQNRSFTLKCFLDCSCVDEECIPELLEDIRKKTRDLYIVLDGDGEPTVLFDFECERMNKMYRLAEELEDPFNEPSVMHVHPFID